MTRLSFNCEFKSTEMSSVDLPIEIRTPNYSLIRRTTKSQPVDLGPGEYHVSTRFPSGLGAHTLVHIGADDTAVRATLRPEANALSPAEGLEPTLLLLGRTKAVFADATALASEHMRGTESIAASFGVMNFELRGFTGNPAVALLPAPDGWHRHLPDGTSELAKFAVPSSASPLTLEIAQPDFPSRTILLPVSVKEGAEIVVTARPKGGVSVDVRLQHTGADALMRYLQRGQFDTAASTGLPVTAETLLEGKIDGPIAACVGAYALLRLGDLDRFHDWSRNLCAWFPSLPDGAAIQAEYLARRGQHEDAARYLLLLRARGTPVFTDGLSYATNRLRQYTRSTIAVPRDALEETLARLDRFAAVVDYRRSLTTYNSADIGASAL